MPFRFRMQKILDYREQLEEDAKLALAQAQARKKIADDRLHEVEDAIQSEERKRRENPTMNAAEFWVADQYMRGLQDDLKTSTFECKMAQSLVEEAKKVLTIRAINKKMLAKLKERQQFAWNREERIKEQHFNDEIATIRYKKAPAG